MNSTTTKKQQNDPVLTRPIDDLAQAVDPDQLILFGSRAEGSSNVESDYDILILKEEVADERILADKAYRVLFDEAFPSPVDIVVAESEHYANSSWGLLSEVRRQGISIYERP